MTPAAVRPGPVSLDLAPHPFRPTKDVFGSFRLYLAVVVVIAVLVAAGHLVRQFGSAGFATYLDRRS